LKTLFDIGGENEAGSDYTLLLEIGREHVSTAYLHKKNNAIHRVHVQSFDELEMEDEFPGILFSLKEQSFESVVVCSAFPQALLFPTRYFKKDYSALNSIYDLPAQAYFYDTIEDWQLVNAYAMPETIYDSLTETFQSIQFIHCYTPAIKIYNGYVADNQLSVHFSGQYFRLLLKKDMAVHLVQTYPYKTPLDVIYYLLRICHEFELQQQEVFLILSGLVEKESNLYTDLQQYFSNIHFAQQPEIRLPQSPHPHYFFTGIYNLAACVS
jgi:hypothetical protein